MTVVTPANWAATDLSPARRSISLALGWPAVGHHATCAWSPRYDEGDGVVEVSLEFDLGVLLETHEPSPYELVGIVEHSGTGEQGEFASVLFVEGRRVRVRDDRIGFGHDDATRGCECEAVAEVLSRLFAPLPAGQDRETLIAVGNAALAGIEVLKQNERAVNRYSRTLIEFDADLSRLLEIVTARALILP
jgi:hypothetical protein